MKCIFCNIQKCFIESTQPFKDPKTTSFSDLEKHADIAIKYEYTK